MNDDAFKRAKKIIGLYMQNENNADVQNGGLLISDKQMEEALNSLGLPVNEPSLIDKFLPQQHIMDGGKGIAHIEKEDGTYHDVLITDYYPHDNTFGGYDSVLGKDVAIPMERIADFYLFHDGQ